MGPSSQENASYNNLNSAAGFQTGVGEGDVTAASTYMRNILSGDPTLIAQSLAPQISAGQNQVQQQAKTSAEFGNRAGGTNASNASATSTERGNIINAVGGLQSGTASNLMSAGTSLVNSGASAYGNLFNEAGTMQKQRAAKWSDLISSIASTAGGVVAGLPGSPGGLQDLSSNILGGMS